MRFKKVFIAIISTAMCFTMFGNISVTAEVSSEIVESSIDTTLEGELTPEQLVDELLKAGYTRVSDEYVNNMLSNYPSAYSMEALSLPYSSGVAFGGSMTYALSPVFDVSGKLNNKKQVLLNWSKNKGTNKISATSYIYLPVLGDWYESTTKNTSTSPASIVIPSTVNESISQFYVKFNRNDLLYATDFDYTLSIADYPLT